MVATRQALIVDATEGDVFLDDGGKRVELAGLFAILLGKLLVQGLKRLVDCVQALLFAFKSRIEASQVLNCGCEPTVQGAERVAALLLHAIQARLN
ncbi:hypothetical protein D3C77_252990 [compost metagenome]